MKHLTDYYQYNRQLKGRSMQDFTFLLLRQKNNIDIGHYITQQLKHVQAPTHLQLTAIFLWLIY